MSGATETAVGWESGTEALVLECGVPRQDCLAALGYSTAKVQGCLLTHEHGDHAHYIEDYLPLMPVYCSQGTAEAVESARTNSARANLGSSQRKPTVLAPLRTVSIGGFRVRPIPADHDAAEPFAYLIDHEDIGRLLFATDTYYLRYRIPDLTSLMIECNYSLPLLNANVAAGLVPAALKNRTRESHMSLEHLREMLAANDLTRVTQIVLIHLSARNSDPQAFCREIIRQTGKPTTYAHKGLTIELNKTPF